MTDDEHKKRARFNAKDRALNDKHLSIIHLKICFNILRLGLGRAEGNTFQYSCSTQTFDLIDMKG